MVFNSLYYIHYLILAARDFFSTGSLFVHLLVWSGRTEQARLATLARLTRLLCLQKLNVSCAARIHSTDNQFNCGASVGERNYILQAQFWHWKEPCWPSRAWTAWGRWHIHRMKYGGTHTVLMTVKKQGKGNLSCIPLPPPRIWVIINLQSFVQKNKPKSSHCLPKHVFMSTTSPKRPFYCEQMWSPSVTASVWRAFVPMGTSWHWGTYLTNLVAKLSKEVAQRSHVPLAFAPWRVRLIPCLARCHASSLAAAQQSKLLYFIVIPHPWQFDGWWLLTVIKENPDNFGQLW